MNSAELMIAVREIIEEAKTGALATVDKDGAPHVRWVTPALLKTHPYSIFMVTSPSFAKTQQVRDNPAVEWMFQTRALNIVINITGTMEILEDPYAESEVLETIAPKLRAFWRLTPQNHDLIVLQTHVRKAKYCVPMKGYKIEIDFPAEDSDAGS